MFKIMDFSCNRKSAKKFTIFFREMEGCQNMIFSTKYKMSEKRAILFVKSNWIFMESERNLDYQFEQEQKKSRFTTKNFFFTSSKCIKLPFNFSHFSLLFSSASLTWIFSRFTFIFPAIIIILTHICCFVKKGFFYLNDFFCRFDLGHFSCIAFYHA